MRFERHLKLLNSGLAVCHGCGCTIGAEPMVVTTTSKSDDPSNLLCFGGRCLHLRDYARVNDFVCAVCDVEAFGRVIAPFVRQPGDILSSVEELIESGYVKKDLPTEDTAAFCGTRSLGSSGDLSGLSRKASVGSEAYQLVDNYRRGCNATDAGPNEGCSVNSSTERDSCGAPGSSDSHFVANK